MAASADSESPLSPAHPPSESGSPPLRSDEERESPKYDPPGLEERLEARRDAEADEKMEPDPFNVAGYTLLFQCVQRIWWIFSFGS